VSDSPSHAGAWCRATASRCGPVSQDESVWKERISPKERVERTGRDHRCPNPFWLPKVQEENSAVRFPEWGPNCAGCAQCDHLLKSVSGQSVCDNTRFHTEHEHGRRLCDYRRCRDPTTHYTAVCADLHVICDVCQLRGHWRRCKPTDPVWVNRALADWERVADKGLYTRLRWKTPQWGFFCLRVTLRSNPDGRDYAGVEAETVQGGYASLVALGGAMGLVKVRGELGDCTRTIRDHLYAPESEDARRAQRNRV
jgi:hypothetical protein